MNTKTTKHRAQDRIIGAICNEALRADEAGDEALAEAIRKEGERICRRYGVTEVSGLPGTWPQTT